MDGNANTKNPESHGMKHFIGVKQVMELHRINLWRRFSYAVLQSGVYRWRSGTAPRYVTNTNLGCHIRFFVAFKGGGIHDNGVNINHWGLGLVAEDTVKVAMGLSARATDMGCYCYFLAAVNNAQLRSAMDPWQLRQLDFLGETLNKLGQTRTLHSFPYVLWQHAGAKTLQMDGEGQGENKSGSCLRGTNRPNKTKRIWGFADLYIPKTLVPKRLD